MKSLIAPAVATLLLVAGAGCGASPDPATTPAPIVTTTSPAASTPSAGGLPTPGAYFTPTAPRTVALDPTSLTDLKNDLEDAGLDCDEWDVAVKNVQGTCDDLIILGFSDGTKNRDKFMKASADLAWQYVQNADREDDIAVVVGDNWWMRVALTDAETLEETGIGGEILD